MRIPPLATDIILQGSFLSDRRRRDLPFVPLSPESQKFAKVVSSSLPVLNIAKSPPIVVHSFQARQADRSMRLQRRLAAATVDPARPISVPAPALFFCSRHSFFASCMDGICHCHSKVGIILSGGEVPQVLDLHSHGERLRNNSLRNLTK